MVIMCDVFGCNSKYPAVSTFHRFPSDPVTSAKWVSLSGNKSLLGKTVQELRCYLMCSNHFQVDENQGNVKELSFEGIDTVPSLFLPTPISVLAYNMDSKNEVANIILVEANDKISQTPLPKLLQFSPGSANSQEMTKGRRGTAAKSKTEERCNRPMSVPQTPFVDLSQYLECKLHDDALTTRTTTDLLFISTTTSNDQQSRTLSICRLCSKANKDVIGIFSVKGSECGLPNKINSILPIKVKNEDCFPTDVCFSCVQKLETAYELTETCATADLAFKLMFLDAERVNVGAEILKSTVGQAVEKDVELMDTREVISVNIKHPQCMCHICNIDFFKVSEFKVHLKKVHHIPFIFKCRICLVFFSSKECLRDHYTELHNAELFAKKVVIRKKLRKNKTSKLPSVQLECGHNEMCLPLGDTSTIRKHTAVHPDCISNSSFPIQSAGGADIQTALDEQSGYGTTELMDTSPSLLAYVNEEKEDPNPLQLKCHACNCNFPGAHEFMVHMNKVHHVPSFKCKFCSVFFSSKSSLRDHSGELHNTKLVVKKVLTRKKFEVNKRRRRSRKGHHKCNYCEICLPISDKAAIKKHRAEHRDKIKTQKLLNSNIICEKCNCKFATEKSKAFHLRIVHKVVNDKNVVKRLLECNQCDRKYYNRVSFLLHIKQHENVIKSFHCWFCEESFISEKLLIVHARNNHKQETCYLCNKPFSHGRKKSLISCSQSHQLNNLVNPVQPYNRSQVVNAQHFSAYYEDDLQRSGAEKIRNFLCSICDQSFRHLKVYVEHLKMHDMGLSLCCNICQKSFDSASSLTKHLEAHPETLNFNFSQCKQVLVSEKQQSDQPQHSFQCEVCLKILSSKEVLERHISRYHSAKEMSLVGRICQDCDKEYSTDGTVSCIRKFMVKTLSCHICGKQYMNKWILDQHILTHNKSPEKDKTISKI